MQLYKLNQLLLDMHSGGTPDTSKPEYWNGDFKWLSSGETRQRFIENTESRITQLGIEKSSTKLAKKNDVVMACAGQGKTRGQVSFLLDDMYINQSVIAMTTDEKILHPLYLFYNLLGRYNELRGSSDASSTRGSITTKSLKKLAILIPNIDSQKNITDILIAYDNLIENNNKRICLLEQMAENLYKEWFVRFRFPGYVNEHFIEGIPSSWSYVQLGDIASFDRGISYSSDEINCDDGINLINLKNIQSYGGFRRDGTKQYNGKYKDSQIVVVGDLILGVTDMTQDRRTVGSVALIPQSLGISAISADLVKVNLKVPNVFFYCMCRYGFYSKYFSQFANGANVLHLKPNVLLNKKILLPTAELIEAFAEKVQPMIDIVDDLNRQNDLLAKQRDMLLPRLMSGKLEV